MAHKQRNGSNNSFLPRLLFLCNMTKFDSCQVTREDIKKSPPTLPTQLPNSDPIHQRPQLLLLLMLLFITFNYELDETNQIGESVCLVSCVCFISTARRQSNLVAKFTLKLATGFQSANQLSLSHLKASPIYPSRRRAISREAAYLRGGCLAKLIEADTIKRQARKIRLNRLHRECYFSRQLARQRMKDGGSKRQQEREGERVKASQLHWLFTPD